MQPIRSITVLASVVSIVGLSLFCGALLVADAPLYLRLCSAASGALMIGGAVQLFRAKRTALALLWLSVATYALSILVPGTAKHGLSVFNHTISAFYWSLATRISLALLAHIALRRSLAGG
ncbi:hypothetical protein [Niveibacterium sp. COAC-50]|uniref:hypothetical protein n=1 Tax=Niveibacterium sp. COAC-50 TaxID=2729384 RepID=UPI0015554682|nr:hypothetical protein [Niveibacterium sp. COAC-50]